MTSKPPENLQDRDAAFVRNALRDAANALEAFAGKIAEDHDTEPLEDIAVTLRQACLWLLRCEPIS
jgi:hypothetical protein